MTARRGSLSKQGIAAGDDVIFTGDLDFLGEIIFLPPVGKPVTVKAAVGESGRVFEIQNSGGVFTAGIAFNGHVFGTIYCFPDGTIAVQQNGANTEVRAAAGGSVQLVTDAGTLAFTAGGVFSIPGTLQMSEQASPPSQGAGGGHFFTIDTIPTTAGFVDDTNVAHTLAFTDDIIGYVLDWGGNLTVAGRFTRVDGNPEGAQITGLGVSSERTVPKAGTLTTLSWNSASADGTTVMKVHKNGAVEETLTLSGTSGTIAMTTAVVAGDKVALEIDAGTTPGNSNWTMYIE